MDNLRPTEIIIGDNKYYNADELSNYDPDYFHGCSRTVRHILNRKAITSDDYVYATLNKKTRWVISADPQQWLYDADQERPAIKASLLLSAKWVIENIPKMMPSSNESKELLEEHVEAPEIIILDEEAKFRDDDGKTYEIETRGIINSNNIYFLASDVAKVLAIPDLHKIVID